MPLPKFTNHFLISNSNAQLSVLNLLELSVTCAIIDHSLFFEIFSFILYYTFSWFTSYLSDYSFSGFFFLCPPLNTESPQHPILRVSELISSRSSNQNPIQNSRSHSQVPVGHWTSQTESHFPRIFNTTRPKLNLLSLCSLISPPPSSNCNCFISNLRSQLHHVLLSFVS